MKGIDANVLVRYIVQDDVEQSKLATLFIEKEATIESPVFINSIVMCEMVWVLESAYEYSRQEISKVIQQILRTREFQVHQPEILWQALFGYQHKGADFADHYIASSNAHEGCSYTVSFDKKAVKAANFKSL